VTEELQCDKGYGKKDLEERQNSKRDRQRILDIISTEQSMQIDFPPGQLYRNNIDEGQHDRRKTSKPLALEVNIRKM